MNRRIASLLGLSLGLWTLAAAPVLADTFTPDTFDDMVDPKPGDGTCGSGKGTCSLRAAVQEANASTHANRIELAQGTYNLSLDGPDESLAATGDLDLNTDVEIVGRGVGLTIVQQKAKNRIFEVTPKGTAKISDLLLRGGMSLGDDGGSILVDGSLKIENMTIDHGRAKVDALNTNGSGGGIRNRGHLDAMNLIVGACVSDGRGGGISNSGMMNLANSLIVDNASRTDAGGGIYNDGELVIAITQVSANTANDGGGLDNVGGKVRIVDSTFSGNKATGGTGGGIRNAAKDAALTIVNSTFNSNVGQKIGGGLANASPATADLNNVTFAQNASGDGGGIVSDKASGVVLSNTVLATNTAGPGGAADCKGEVTSRGHNLVGKPGSCDFKGEGDLIGKDPKLGALSPNDGPTRTRALLDGSPAIGGGSPKSPDGKDGACAPADQRGVKRPQAYGGDTKPACDIGAYEAQNPKTGALPSAGRGA
ncbi:MAG: choice-of-anchor Q domain-containing protein [Alphaproteobacteria bacterium]